MFRLSFCPVGIDRTAFTVNEGVVLAPGEVNGQFKAREWASISEGEQSS